jgi:hypothetical protein
VRAIAAFLVACALAAVAPLAPRASEERSSVPFPGWPASFDGTPLAARPLVAREQRFAAEFPGRIGAFEGGGRRFVVRWVTRATRRLHPASDCFRGAGYVTTPQPLFRDEAGREWGVFLAERAGVRLRVRERIVDANGSAFTDASSWYWAALLDRSEGPWSAWTVIEPEARPLTPV